MSAAGCSVGFADPLEMRLHAAAAAASVAGSTAPVEVQSGATLEYQSAQSIMSRHSVSDSEASSADFVPGLPAALGVEFVPITLVFKNLRWEGKKK